MKFYRCKKCPNIVIKLSVGRCTPACCGELMDELQPNTVDAAVEKHIPVIVEENGEKYVVVGSVEHPMSEEHYIEWVVMEYENRYDIVKFNPGDAPKAKITNGEPKNVYAYCNLHGLWAQKQD